VIHPSNEEKSKFALIALLGDRRMLVRITHKKAIGLHLLPRWIVSKFEREMGMDVEFRVQIWRLLRVESQ
jgi:hypothetical protein